MATKNNRDDFSAKTKKILAERTGHLCSNPTCVKHTVGPHTDDTKSTSIGKAAHITAAASGGARYNSLLTPAERQSINNGIWLCSNCADLIDKDERKYPTQTLNSWKDVAEYKMRYILEGNQIVTKVQKTPFVELDFSWTCGSRSPIGLSDKNPLYPDDDGQMIMMFGAGFPPKINWWSLRWDFTIAIHNNTSYAAVNVKIEQIGDVRLSELESLNKINCIESFKSIELKASYTQVIEGIYKEADNVLKFKIPERLEGMNLLISYLDEDRVEHKTFVTVENNIIVNRKG